MIELIPIIAQDAVPDGDAAKVIMIVVALGIDPWAVCRCG